MLVAGGHLTNMEGVVIMPIYRKCALMMVFPFILITVTGFPQSGHVKDCKTNQPQNESVAPEFFFRSLDENIPAAVKKTRSESVVAVRVGVPHWEKSPGIHYDFSHGAGFVPAGWDGHVLTTLHLMGAHPAAWVSGTYPLIIQVFDGQNAFDAKMISFNPDADLALLQVVAGSGGEQFSSKPAVMIADTLTDSQKKDFWPEKFYAFSFFPRHPEAFFTLTIGPWRAVTNALHESRFPLGNIQGGVEPGFSGGPLLTPDGVVAGMLVEVSPAFSYVILVETMKMFLDESAPPAEAKPEEKK